MVEEQKKKKSKTLAERIRYKECQQRCSTHK